MFQRAFGVMTTVLLVAACHHSTTKTPPPAMTTMTPPCVSSTQFAYDPDSKPNSAAAFPDDYFTVDDSSSLTGLSVTLTSANAPWTTYNIPDGLTDTFSAFNGLDGWGTSAGITLRFTAALGTQPNGSPASINSATLQLWELGANAHRVPYETQVTDDNTTVILWPMVPLTPETQHAVIMTREAPTAAGDPVCPSTTFQSLLDGTTTSATLQRLVPRYTAALSAANIKATDVGAAVVFTTQSISEQSIAIDKDIEGRTFAWLRPPTCTPMQYYQLCTGTYTAGDYRNSAGVVEGTTPVDTYVIPVRIWLPLTAPKPWPMVIFGHGLGGNSSEGDPLGQLAAPLGIAACGIDAVDHGQHPGAPAGQLPDILAFFGMNTGTLEPLVLRDNFRQSTYDKLQLLQLLSTVGDVDGDGKPDLDQQHLAYFGASLGGIMGGEFMSVQDKTGLGVLSVPGGRVTSIIEYAPQFAFLPQLFLGPHNTQGDIDRFFPILQAIIDRGDAVNYGNHILSDRFASAASPVPHILFQEALNDDTVGNVSNHALARALNIPVLPPELTPVGLVPLLTGTSVSGDLLNGTTTAALFQFDRITEVGDPNPRPVTHSSLSASVEGLYQTQEFLETWLDAGIPEIVNPYAVLGTPELADGGMFDGGTSDAGL